MNTEESAHRQPDAQPMAPAKLERPPTGPLRVKTPYRDDNRQWFHHVLGSRAHVKHVGGGVWEVARSNFKRSLFDALAERFGSVEVTFESKESQKCTEECSEGDPDNAGDCECICLGDNHGGGDHNWTHVGHSLLVRPGIVRRVRVIYRQGDQ
jgi:hypothetical protein